jgi:diketogulonate reductase-like aldo/keto reductase
VAGYKINLQKLLLFHTPLTTKQRKNIWKKMPFIVASNTIKYLGVNLTEDLNNLYMENYKP